MTSVLEKGAVIADRFEIERLVEHGGMGSVYRALDRVEGRPAALKLIVAPFADAHDLERFKREAELLESLRHPRIVRHICHGEMSDARPYLAMEWLEGEDLRSALSRGPLSPANAMRVLEGAAEVLSAVHARSIIHRDLSSLAICSCAAARLRTSRCSISGSPVICKAPGG